MIIKNCLSRFFKTILGAVALTGKLSGLQSLKGPDFFMNVTLDIRFGPDYEP